MSLVFGQNKVYFACIISLLLLFYTESDESEEEQNDLTSLVSLKKRIYEVLPDDILPMPQPRKKR